MPILLFSFYIIENLVFKILFFNKAVETIDNWNLLCEHGITVTLENNNLKVSKFRDGSDIQYIANASEQLKTTSNVLKTATTTLKNKLSQYKYC